MGAMTYLSVTVRKADRGLLNSTDLDQFADFLEQEILDGCLGNDCPHVATDQKSMYTYCEWCGFFESEILVPFAMSHPEYQVEVIAECSEGDDRERVLYHGNVMESHYEVRNFPDPTIINWKYGE